MAASSGTPFACRPPSDSSSRVFSPERAQLPLPPPPAPQRHQPGMASNARLEALATLRLVLPSTLLGVLLVRFAVKAFLSMMAGIQAQGWVQLEEEVVPRAGSGAGGEGEEDEILPVVVRVRTMRRGLVLGCFAFVASTYFAEGVVQGELFALGAGWWELTLALCSHRHLDLEYLHSRSPSLRQRYPLRRRRPVCILPLRDRNDLRGAIGRKGGKLGCDLPSHDPVPRAWIRGGHRSPPRSLHQGRCALPIASLVC